MPEFIGLSKVTVDDRFLDQVIASRRENQNGASEPTDFKNEILEDNFASARDQASEFIKSHFSLGREMTKPRFCTDIDNVIALTDTVMRRASREYTQG